jgi:hypothetical protein
VVVRTFAGAGQGWESCYSEGEVEVGVRFLAWRYTPRRLYLEDVEKEQVILLGRCVWRCVKETWISSDLREAPTITQRMPRAAGRMKLSLSLPPQTSLQLNFCAFHFRYQRLKSIHLRSPSTTLTFDIELF